jgi:hypothetical protein
MCEATPVGGNSMKFGSLVELADAMNYGKYDLEIMNSSGSTGCGRFHRPAELSITLHCIMCML